MSGAVDLAEQELRLRCVDLAVRAGSGFDCVDTAAKIHQFVVGEKPVEREDA